DAETSKGPWETPSRLTTHWFSTPTRGSTSSIQPSAVESAGRKKDSQNMNSRPCAQGTFVRASTQASRTPMGKEMSWYQKATLSVFQSDWNTPGVAQAWAQARAL